MRRGLRDLVTMPLPQQWGPTVMPPGAISIPGASAAPTPVIGQDGQMYLSFPPTLSNPAGAITPAIPNNGRPTPVVAPDGSLYLAFPPSPAYPAGVAYPAAYGPNGVYVTGPAEVSQIPQGNSAPSGVYAPVPVSSPISPLASAPGNPWARQPIVPDSLLPPALQRANPLTRQYIYTPNAYDSSISQDSKRWGWIRAHGGLKSCCRVPELGAPVWDKPPWMVMPSQGEYFQEMFIQPLSAFQDGGGNYTGLDVVLGQFQVPCGWDGALNRVVCQFNGQGFQDFSGQIVWRVLVNSRFARNLGNIKNSFGDFATAFSVPGTDNIRLVSGQTVTLIANIPLASPVNTGFVAAGAFGWFYPRR